MPDGIRSEHSAATAEDEPPICGTATPPALQVVDSNSEDEFESKAFWANLGNEEPLGLRGLERNAPSPVPPGSPSGDELESKEFWANLGNEEPRGLRGQERNAPGSVAPGSPSGPGKRMMLEADTDAAEVAAGSKNSQQEAGVDEW